MRETKETGITLIALVITIIVLLILAGVAINLTIGDNGIFKRAEESVEIYENAANNEATELNTAAGEMEKLILGMSLDIQHTATSDSITVQVNGVNATGYIFSIKKADEENYTAKPEQTESTYIFTGLETTLYKIKIEIKTESVTLEREIEVSTEDTIKPDLAKIIFSATETDANTAITAEVTQTDGQSGVNIGACKWVYNTIAEEIGTDESLYTGGTFNSTTENISLTATAGGTYYLHVLTTDNAGNVIETISQAITVLDLYTITYELNGGTNNSNNPSSYTVKSPSITLQEPQKSGYIFAGWTGSNGSTKQKTVTIEEGSTGNRNYVANWDTPLSWNVYRNATVPNKVNTVSGMSISGTTDGKYGWHITTTPAIPDGATVTVAWQPSQGWKRIWLTSDSVLGNWADVGISASITHTSDVQSQTIKNTSGKDLYLVVYSENSYSATVEVY